MEDRTIELDSFFVSDEQVLNSKLRGKPVVVGGNSNQCGIAATIFAIGLVLVSLFSACINPDISPTSGQITGEEVVMKLPEPEYDSNVSLEQSLL
ncbi:hypothetical protein ACFLV5_02095 [Chloroflexota bacterium]